MKKLLILLFFFPIMLNAQMSGGLFSSRSFVLYGESEIVLKDSTKIRYEGKIAGSKIGAEGRTIDYTEID